jgi:hypothetical protein
MRGILPVQGLFAIAPLGALLTEAWGGQPLTWVVEQCRRGCEQLSVVYRIDNAALSIVDHCVATSAETSCFVHVASQRRDRESKALMSEAR